MVHKVGKQNDLGFECPARVALQSTINIVNTLYTKDDRAKVLRQSRLTLPKHEPRSLYYNHLTITEMKFLKTKEG